MTMYPPERQRGITDLLLLLDGRRASVTQISERLKVTTETVRARPGRAGAPGRVPSERGPLCLDAPTPGDLDGGPAEPP